MYLYWKCLSDYKAAKLNRISYVHFNKENKKIKKIMK